VRCRFGGDWRGSSWIACVDPIMVLSKPASRFCPRNIVNTCCRSVHRTSFRRLAQLTPSGMVKLPSKSPSPSSSLASHVSRPSPSPAMPIETILGLAPPVGVFVPFMASWGVWGFPTEMVDMSELVSLMAPRELRGFPTLRWRIRTGSGGQRMQSESYVGKWILEHLDASVVWYQHKWLKQSRLRLIGLIGDNAARLCVADGVRVWGPLDGGR